MVQNGRSSGRTTSSHIPQRGGIRKTSSTTTPRVDRDGDLVMGGAPAGRGARGARGGARGGRHPHGPNRNHHNQDAAQGLKNIDSQTLEQLVVKGLRAQGPPKGPRNNFKPEQKGPHGKGKREGLDEVSVVGLKDSAAANNAGGGISDLVSFLERKASREAPQGETVKIKKSRLEGAALIVSVRAQDTAKLTKLDGYTFAKAKLSIVVHSKATTQTSPLAEEESSSDTANTIQDLKQFLTRRYNAEMKLLDLSALAQDQELINLGLFTTSARESKFFPALMKVCDTAFTDAKAKEEAIVSVTLAGNSLTNISSVTLLAQTFPALQNLDLSNNQIKNLSALEGWRWRFRKLNHLVLSGNPIETEVPSYSQDILNWYPSLTTLNTNQVRSPEEVEALLKGKLPIATLPASFRDEADISLHFVKFFFPNFDVDRNYLINNCYDEHSNFSFSVNSQAPRVLESSQKTPGWDQYLKRSRNLKKVTHLPAKNNRLFIGIDAIRGVFTTLPPTRHPDFQNEPQKWCVECHTIPGVQDLTGQSGSGVGGMMIVIHGEFTEVDGYTHQGTIKRSFDRTFILGPGGPQGIRVSSDILVLRSYGGYEAWQPEVGGPSQPYYQIPIETRPGFAMPAFAKSEEEVLKERLILELSQRTGMTLEVSFQCLESNGWSLEGALHHFSQAKADLPRHAFIAAC